MAGGLACGVRQVDNVGKECGTALKEGEKSKYSKKRKEKKRKEKKREYIGMSSISV